MSNYYLGVDLGSTTSKAVIINAKDQIIGRGITNTRANYKVAADIARMEAIFDARFSLLRDKLKEEFAENKAYESYMHDIRRTFRFLQFKERMNCFQNQVIDTVANFPESEKTQLEKMVNQIFDQIVPLIRKDFLEGDLAEKNQFFRDILSERYNAEVAKFDKQYLDSLIVIFDKSITPVENEIVNYDFKILVMNSIELLKEKYNNLGDEIKENQSVNFESEIHLMKGEHSQVFESLREHIEHVADYDFKITNMVGTGYGRALLPFPAESIKSEILCHAFGANAIFPGTRTVLDIGGQDTKAIQVNQQGLVTSFHMNDRCAAGCGRYLGYIADEFNLSLNELGPMAVKAEKEVNICSTCTVFAGAEVRELLNLGERREDILAGLHKAIVMRAMSLLARSGGVRNEFTFTGGVARNQAVLKYVSQMVHESYGDDIKINIGSDSIFMGALGAAMFARRNVEVDLPEMKKKKIILNN